MRTATRRRPLGAAALAAGLALIALPGAAYAERRDRDDSARPRDAFEGRAQRGADADNARPQQRAPQQQAAQQQQAAPPPAAQAQSPQRQYAEQRRGGAPGRQGNRDARPGGTADNRVRPAPSQSPQQQAWSGRRDGRSGRAPGDNDYRSDPGRGPQSPQGREGWRGDNGWRDGGRRDGGNRYARDGRDWNRGWRDNRQYDWRGWRGDHRDSFRLGRYYAPYRGWSYRRFSVGFFLQPLFFGSSFWINDPFYYRLPPAYGPYRWVRYYDDALLVNIYTGEVVDTIYDIFW